MSAEPLVVGDARLVCTDGDVAVEVRRAGDWTPLLNSGPAGGLRVRTDADLALDARDVRRTADGLTLALTGENMAAALTLRPRPAGTAVDVTCAVSFAEPTDLEWLWSDWCFLPAHEWAGRAPAHAWVPNLRPEPHQVIGDHCFRSGVMSVAEAGLGVVLRADLAAQARLYPLRSAFDYRADAPPPLLSYGLVVADPEEHMYFGHRDGATQHVPPGTLRLAYTLHFVGTALTDTHPLVVACTAAWDERPDRREGRVAPQTVPYADYARAAYPGVLDLHFVNTPDAGAGTGGVPHWIYADYVGFQCWFNNLRSAGGLAYWGAELAESRWTAAAHAVRALWEAAPRTDGFAPTYYNHARREWFGVADLTPFGPGMADAFGDTSLLAWWSVADNCWTHLNRLWWRRELDDADTVPPDTRAFCDRLAALQAPDGSVPSFVHAETGAVSEVLRASAHTALAAWLWTEVAARDGDGVCLDAAGRAGAFVRERVLPGMRYHDYETFHSCSRKPDDFADPVTRIAPQNTLAMQWSAEALLGLWQLTGEDAWSAAAQEALACLALYQQVWNAPFLNYDTYGGFGVMNTDAEWSDARQAQFARTFLRFAGAFWNRQLAERAVAALRASFTLMALPENARVAPATFRGECPNWPAEHRLRMFAPELAGRYACMPVGHMVENYGHTGLDTPGVRTAFDWGEGSALTAAAEVTREYGHVWVVPGAGWAIGIDGWVAEAARNSRGALSVTVRDGLARRRRLVVAVDAAAPRARWPAGLAPAAERRGDRTYYDLGPTGGIVTFVIET